ncbi:MAG: ShlB/FhaC/HecB family hemolysin secretion/activation protein [Burkholderiales bacterium]|nr:ShlB/FhaC/HecB family hemolysin secretion/activation protein [Burkholderiales bacterium]
MPTSRNTLVRRILGSVAAFAAAAPGLGAAAATVDAGSLLQQTQPAQNRPPAGESAPRITIERAPDSKLGPSAPFRVERIEIDGNVHFSTPQLHALIAEAEGKNLTLAEVGGLAARITAYYRSQGYMLARAIVPAQTIRDGVVKIQVIEAVYGRIALDNESPVHDSVLLGLLSPLHAHDAVTQAALDRSLLLVSDVPGVRYTATLSPGDTVGSSNLSLEVRPGSRYSGTAGLDNFGNSSTGRLRANASLGVNNPLHRGDVFSVNLMSAGEGMNFARAGYETYAAPNGARVGAALSGLSYKLGGAYAPLAGHGTADQAGLWLRGPLVRAEFRNLNAQLEIDHLKLADELDSSATHTDRHADIAAFSLAGDAKGEGFLSSWGLVATFGQLHFDDAIARSVDAGTAKTAGRFSKLDLNVGYLRALGAADSVYLAVAGQWAGSNLDSSQKLQLGGPSTIRSYDSGAVSADSGLYASAELRHDFANEAHGRWQAVAFVDLGRAMQNRRPWSAAPNWGTLEGLGLGARWVQGPWSAKVDVASTLGHSTVLVNSGATTRGWAELNRAF